jgi:hypothetical protein
LPSSYHGVRVARSFPRPGCRFGASAALGVAVVERTTGLESATLTSARRSGL